jgi:hypothetical protein
VGDNTQNDRVGASSSAINPNEVGTSSATRPSKRGKKDENAHDGLVANPHIARVFMKLSLLYKVSCVTSFVDEKF